MRWHILGVGALGGLWAGLLALSGQEPCLLLRRLPAEGRQRLSLQRLDGQNDTFLLPAETAETGTAIEALLVCLKAYDIAPALAALRPRLRPGALVVLMSNGMGYEDEAADSLAHCHVVFATSTQGAWRRGDGGVVQAGQGECWLGSDGGLPADVRDALMTSLARTSADLKWSEEIQLKRWQKLAVNAAINPLTALLNCRNGELLRPPHGPPLLAALCAETETLMRALGLGVGDDEILTRTRFVAAQTAQNFSSMCQDLRNGRRTELAYINGFLLNQAEKAGISLPSHRFLMDLLGLRQALQ